MRRVGALLCCALAGACAPMPPVPEAPPAAPPAMEAPAVREVLVPVEVRVPVPVPEVSPADAAARNLLSYHDRLRQLPPAEIPKEIARLDTPKTPAATLEFALVLGQTRNPGDTQRAIGLLDPLVRSSDPNAAPWQPLARLLLARFAEQRRVEEQLERQNQQLRDNQRKLDQLNDKLEALKAIERSLTTRPPPAPPPPAAPASPPANRTPP